MGRRAYRALARLGYRVGWALLRVYWFVVRPTERGVRCALWRGDELLLVRHSYGDHRWLLPGGRLKRGETTAAGARREILQEVGADVPDWRELGTIESVSFHKHDKTSFLRARLGDAPVQLDRPEFLECVWWPVGQVPDGASPELHDAARRGSLTPP